MNGLFSLLLFCAVCVSCSSSDSTKKLAPKEEVVETLEVPETTVDKALLTYDRMISVWMHNGALFSGNAVSKFADGSLKERFGVLNGRKQNEAISWHPTGQVKNMAHFHLGKLHGEKKTWSEDSTHILIAHLNYVHGKAHGEQKFWYPTGEIFKIIHLEMGREEGIQQAFRKNGKLFANYEAKAGRIFGLKKAALCFGLEDQKLKL